MTTDAEALAILDEYIDALRDLERANKLREACQARKDAAMAALQGMARRKAAEDATH
jgi:hypothetical protein